MSSWPVGWSLAVAGATTETDRTMAHSNAWKVRIDLLRSLRSPRCQAPRLPLGPVDYKSEKRPPNEPCWRPPGDRRQRGLRRRAGPCRRCGRGASSALPFQDRPRDLGLVDDELEHRPIAPAAQEEVPVD